MYLDVLFIENLIINCIIIYLTSLISKRKSRVWKIALASFIGALYVVFYSIGDFEVLHRLSTKILLSFLMVVVAFTPERFMEFFRIVGIFYLVSFIFGGTALALFFILRMDGMNENTFYIKDFSLNLLVISIMVSCLMVKFLWLWLKKARFFKDFYVDIGVEIGNRIKEFRALVDTGNRLYDPFSNWPVMIVELSEIEEILPEDIKFIIREAVQEDILKMVNLPKTSPWVLKIRFIPFMSVGKENGILVGIKPDKIYLKSEGKTITDIIVGIYHKKLFNKKDYNALINPDILN